MKLNLVKTIIIVFIITGCSDKNEFISIIESAELNKMTFSKGNIYMQYEKYLDHTMYHVLTNNEGIITFIVDNNSNISSIVFNNKMKDNTIMTSFSLEKDYFEWGLYNGTESVSIQLPKNRKSSFIVNDVVVDE